MSPSNEGFGSSHQDSDARRYRVGAEVTPDGVSFVVWAPSQEEVAIVVDGREYPMALAAGGYFHCVVSQAGSGSLYRFRLGKDPELYADPASRYQPEGVFGPSDVVDTGSYPWQDQDWQGLGLAGQILYEMHVGTFTPEGTWLAAIEKLPFLKSIGITLIEMMPIQQFSGSFGWGYDGVGWFAPVHIYGRPDDLRRFIDAAHRLGIGVILDVVYNHFGPEGNFIEKFSKDYFTDRYKNDWGASLNFDGPNSDGTRDFVISNAAYWIEAFHFDGLRLDATQSLFDASDDPIVAALTRAARKAAGMRQIVVIAENEPQDSDLVRPLAQGGFGLDAAWNDDFHHSAMVALTGHNEAYYEDHDGTPQEFISAAKYGYLFQGQNYFHQQKPRGMPGLHLRGNPSINFIQNHDQIANSGFGGRFHQLTDPGRARAMTALLLLMPGQPMLFQGQEFWASSPFLYFADTKPDLHEKVRQSRRQSLAQFPSLATPESVSRLPGPELPETFTRSKLDWREVETQSGVVALHRDLLRLRATEPAFQEETATGVDGAILGAEAFLLRFFEKDGEDILLLVNFGPDLHRRSIPDPLIAPAKDRAWSLAWSSEHPIYGGNGTPSFETDRGWRLPGHSALILRGVKIHRNRR